MLWIFFIILLKFIYIYYFSFSYINLSSKLKTEIIYINLSSIIDIGFSQSFSILTSFEKTMISLDAFKAYAYEKMMDVYVSFCRRCDSFSEIITQNHDIVFNKREDVNRINEVHRMLHEIDIRVAEAFEITINVENILENSSNLKLKDFYTYTNITSAHLQASIEMLRSLSALSDSFKRKVD